MIAFSRRPANRSGIGLTMSRTQVKSLSKFYTQTWRNKSTFNNFSHSQNADEDDWNGFEVNREVLESSTTSKPAEHAKSQKSATKVKSTNVVDDFTSLDVKSKKVVTTQKPKDDKEDDLWDMLNS